jgi:hypothetical protein
MKTLLSVCALMAMMLGAEKGFARSTGQAAPVAPRSVASLGADADTGYLDIASDPQGAKILIDDRDTGKTTPQSHLALAAGHHKLVLITPDGAHRRGIGFTVEAGQTTQLTIHLAS